MPLSFRLLAAARRRPQTAAGWSSYAPAAGWRLDSRGAEVPAIVHHPSSPPCCCYMKGQVKRSRGEDSIVVQPRGGPPTDSESVYHTGAARGAGVNRSCALPLLRGGNASEPPQLHRCHWVRAWAAAAMTSTHTSTAGGLSSQLAPDSLPVVRPAGTATRQQARTATG